MLTGRTRRPAEGATESPAFVNLDLVRHTGTLSGAEQSKVWTHWEAVFRVGFSEQT
jgi:hypothetical protein